MGGWRDEWETTGYVAFVGTMGDRYRVRIRVERGRVTRFTVQFEVWREERFHPAIRYDTAHGRPHRDTLDWRGRVVDKQWLPMKPYAQALDEAVEEVKANWLPNRQEFERRRS